MATLMAAAHWPQYQGSPAILSRLALLQPGQVPTSFLCKDYQQLEKAGRRLHFIKASPNGRFIKGKQMASPNDNFIKQVQWPLCQGQPEGHFIKAALIMILLMQIAISSNFIKFDCNCRFIKAGHSHFIKASPNGNFMMVAAGRAKLFLAKASPMAVLSTRGPMAVYQGRSKRMARPPDFSDKLHFCYYPARSVYHRPGQAILSKSRPNGRFINARPNDRFIRMARPPDFSNKLHFRYYPARSVYQRPGQAILSKRPNGRFINARLNGRFLRPKPLLRRINSLSTAGRPRLIAANDRFIKANGRFIKAGHFQARLLEVRSDIAPRKQFINGQPSEAKPIVVVSRQALTTANGRFIKANGRFINAIFSKEGLQRKNCWASEIAVPY